MSPLNDGKYCIQQSGEIFQNMTTEIFSQCFVESEVYWTIYYIECTVHIYVYIYIYIYMKPSEGEQEQIQAIYLARVRKPRNLQTFRIQLNAPRKLYISTAFCKASLGTCVWIFISNDRENLLKSFSISTKHLNKCYSFIVQLLLLSQQQQQQALIPCFFGPAMDLQHITQGWPHVFIFSILFYMKLYSDTSFIDTSFFITCIHVTLGLSPPFFIPST